VQAWQKRGEFYCPYQLLENRRLLFDGKGGGKEKASSVAGKKEVFNRTPEQGVRRRRETVGGAL